MEQGTTTHELSRRHFLRGAVLGAVAVVGGYELAKLGDTPATAEGGQPAMQPVAHVGELQRAPDPEAETAKTEAEAEKARAEAEKLRSEADQIDAGTDAARRKAEADARTAEANAEQEEDENKNRWPWLSNVVELSPYAALVIAAGGGAVGLAKSSVKWVGSVVARRRAEDESERAARQQAVAEQRKQEDTAFDDVKARVLSEDPKAMRGADIALGAFTREGYERFRREVWDLCVGFLQHRDVNPRLPQPTPFERNIIGAMLKVLPGLYQEELAKREELLIAQSGKTREDFNPAALANYVRSVPVLDASGVRLDGANLAGHVLAGIDWDNASFNGAKLAGAIFTNVSLQGAQFVGADLRKATFRNAQSQGMKLTRAVVTGTEFADVDLQNVDLERARGDLSTVLIEYWEGTDSGLTTEQLAELTGKGVRFRIKQLPAGTATGDEDLFALRL